LDGADWLVQLRSDLLTRLALLVLHVQQFSGLGRQSGEVAVQLPQQVLLLFQLGSTIQPRRDRKHIRRLGRREQERALATEPLAAAIVSDAEQPAAKLVWPPARVQGAICFQEGLLHEVLDMVGLSDSFEYKAAHRPVIADRQLVKGPAVTPDAARDQLGIAG